MAEKTETAKEGDFASSFSLDSRLSRALAKKGFAQPTAVQKAVIPLALQGKDVLAKSRTGSGKTLAYVLPVLNKLLQERGRVVKGSDESGNFLGALILVPTKELSRQVLSVCKELMVYCGKYLTVSNLSSEDNISLQKAMLQSDILISTPSRVLLHFDSGDLNKEGLKKCAMLVFDEADLMLRYEYGNDLKRLKPFISPMTQTLMMSATLSPELQQLSALLLSKPESVDIIPEESENQLKEFCIHCPSKDKNLIVYVILKMKLISGKVLIFVNDVDGSYRLKLFLEQFGIKSAVINGELPINSRFHIMEEFNRGIYDIVIASDFIAEDAPIEDNEKEIETVAKKRKNKTDPEFGVSRGIDFQQVAAVINFDFPLNYTTYCHRIGRTARGNANGTALSFVSEKDELIFAKVEQSQKMLNKSENGRIETYNFDLESIEQFRYRVDDASRKITKSVVKQARIQDIRSELLKSEKLASHWEANPKDLDALRHDTALLPNRIQSHLKHIPNYLMVKGNNEKVKLPETIAAPVSVSSKKRTVGKRFNGPSSKKKRSDPLKKLASAK